MAAFLKKLFGSSNDRRVKALMQRAQAINALEAQAAALTDAQLATMTNNFRLRHSNGEPLDHILNDAFAVVREAAKRVLGQRHYDVQLVGGMVLHQGGIAEMRTGEGKTLVSTLPAYLNAISGKGVHVVTVNDYLARRDAEWMGQVHRFLGVSVGCIAQGISPMERRAAYECDITYGPNNEFGFDYLRDNLVYERVEMVQRGHNFAIVDEVDSILIDEARTPLIISGPTDDRSALYKTVDAIIPLLDKSHFDLDEKSRQVHLNEEGNERIENLLVEHQILEGSLYDAANISIVHHVNQALRAHKLYSRDKDYIIKDGEIILIDEFTGRMMQGRRLSEGLHQAIEAKEQVEIQPENQTLASVTLQNYFRMYNTLSGMTGTAATEATEFHDTYKMDVVAIPTNRAIARKDIDDEVYRTAAEKNAAALVQIEDCYKRRQPILVGTVSIEKSEELSDLLKAKNIPHQVLNARYHEQEAYIVAQAGVPGAVTIATNMAGRGTDIQLGGNIDMRMHHECPEDATPEQRVEIKERLVREIENLRREALDAGGLYVLGTERHESRRIDNQLRGRTGRQGDPGVSKFYLSFEDDLLRIFAADRLDRIMQSLGMQEGEAIAHTWLTKAIETAQKRVEARNYDIRKNLLKYDDVINDQRKAMFEQRVDVLDSDDISDIVHEMRHDVIEGFVAHRLPPKAFVEQWDIEGLDADVKEILGVDLPIAAWAVEDGIANEEMTARLIAASDEAYAKRESLIGTDRLRRLERAVVLQTLDYNWREHLMHLDHLRAVIGLRGYAQRDPLNEYKSEAFQLFGKLLTDLRTQTTRTLMTMEVIMEPLTPGEHIEIHVDASTGENEMAQLAEPPLPPAPVVAMPASDAVEAPLTLAADFNKTPRNANCPCGSGKKFKHCHGVMVGA
jgi:preprotein translocase subunit SecA